MTTSTDMSTAETLPADGIIATHSGHPARAAELPAHLVRLPGDGSWALWRWMGLRGAGFPAARIQTLAAPACTAAAERLLDSAERAQHARDLALTALNEALDRLRQEHAWDDSARRDPLLKATRLLKKGRLPEPGALAVPEQAPIEAIRAADAALDGARDDYGSAFEAATAQLTRAIYEAAADNDFREAIIWQNRRAFHTGIQALLKRPPDAGARDSKQRQHEELVAQYMQRYCVKNDTIGFFGPVGWAKLNSGGAALTMRLGGDLLERRSVYFEQWCIDALAETLARNRAILPWLAPRRLPYVRLDGSTLILPPERAIRLPAAQMLVLRACDGRRAAVEIAQELARAYPGDFRSAEQVYIALGVLKNMGVIAWTLEVPFQQHPERALRERLERIGDERLRSVSLQALRAVEAARTAVADAAGSPERLDRAQTALESIFTRLTGAASTRSDGSMYAGRTLVYEDCRRDIQMEVGPAFLDALGPPLSLLLESARWFTFEAAARYRPAFRAVYTDLVRQRGTTSIDALSFWLQIQNYLGTHGAELMRDMVHGFQERWAEIFSLAPEQRRLAYTSAALWPQVRRAFDAPRPGWQLARYHCPDVMVAATSVEAFRQGQFQLVMGELHIASNTLRGSFFVAEHPAPDELFQSVASDLAGLLVAPLVPRNWPEATSRTRPVLGAAAPYRLVFSNDVCDLPPEQILPIADLVIADDEGELVVRTHDGRVQVSIVECFADLLSRDVLDRFKLFPPLAHTPRITIDRLVVCRETWRFVPAELEFAAEKHDADRFLAARRWMRAHALPRYVFVTSPVERKPVYIDFDSPILVNILAKIVRRTAESGPKDALISVTEMLPTIEQIWLPDAAGRNYTSEFRIVAVDCTP